MASHRDGSQKPHPITLKTETYQRLERYKVRLISERGTSKVTFEDAVNALLDLAELGGSKK